MIVGNFTFLNCAKAPLKLHQQISIKQIFKYLKFFSVFFEFRKKYLVISLVSSLDLYFLLFNFYCK